MRARIVSLVSRRGALIATERGLRRCTSRAAMQSWCGCAWRQSAARRMRHKLANEAGRLRVLAARDLGASGERRFPRGRRALRGAPALRANGRALTVPASVTPRGCGTSATPRAVRTASLSVEHAGREGRAVSWRLGHERFTSLRYGRRRECACSAGGASRQALLPCRVPCNAWPIATTSASSSSSRLGRCTSSSSTTASAGR